MSDNQPRYLFLDTCIIQHLGSSEKAKAEAVSSCLQNLGDEGYRLVISEFSIYEKLRNLFGQKAEAAAKLLKTYERKSVSNYVLIMASILSGLYRQEKVDYISDGDIIIAATAFIEAGYVLTENHRDFPHPFFTTEKSIVVSFQVNGRYTKTQDFAIYKPNASLIARRINELDTTS